MGFNQKHFEKTGELLSWPKWETIAAQANLSENRILRGFRKFERLGALKIIHGGRDRQTGWRLPNEYVAINPPATKVVPEKPYQAPSAIVAGGHPPDFI